MNHTHSWRRLKANKFQCCHPTCYSKMTLDHLEGKLAQCINCEATFLIRGVEVKPTDPTLVCPNCKTGEYHLTVEGRTKYLQEVAVSNVLKLSKEADEALKLREEALNKREVQLDNREREHLKRKVNLDNWALNEQNKFALRLEEYGKKLADLRIQRERIALKLRDRRERLTVERRKFKLAQTKIAEPKVETVKSEPSIDSPVNQQIGNSVMEAIQEILLGDNK